MIPLSGTTFGAGKDLYPQVWYKNKWHPVCGHYFWDNNDGATTFCKQLGFSSGVRGRRSSKFNVDAMPVGKCRAGQKFNKCNAGGHAWGNFNYHNSWCKKGKNIAQAIKCSSGKTDSCFKGGLVVDIRASDYSGKGSVWKARVGPSARLYGNLRFNKAEGSLFFDNARQYAAIDINTDGADMPRVTYAMWAKLEKPIPNNNLGWVMSQYPDQGWSCSITLNDGRLSHTHSVSITYGSGWRNSLPKPPVKQWFHVVATYAQDQQSCTFLNGKAGGCVRARNGWHPSRKEKLILGGRGPNDGRHNPSVKVGSAQVYSAKLLTRSEVTKLYTSSIPKQAPATAAKNCQDGDVCVAIGTSIGANKDMYPEVAYKGKWYPICGHYFWDNNHGATTFCKQLGYNSGVRRHTQVNFNVDSMPVGKCNPGQRFNKCNAGGHAWGNLNYHNSWCKAGAQWGGRGIGVAVRCSGSKGRTSSCGQA